MLPLRLRQFVASFLIILLSSTQVTLASPIREPKPEVLLIEDAHSDELTQKAITRLLEEITRKEKPDFIAVEGAWTRLTPGVLQFTQNPRKNREILIRLLTQGEISGTDLFAAENSASLVFEGVEDREIYRQYFHILRELLAQYSLAESFSSKTRQRLIDESKKTLGPELSEFLAQHESFEEGNLGLTAFLDILSNTYRSAYGTDLTAIKNQMDFPSLLRIFALRKNQSVPDAKQIAKAFKYWRNDLDAFGLAQAFESELAELANEIEGVKPSSRNFSLRHLLESLWDRSRATGRLLEIPAVLKSYFRVRMLAEEISSEELFQEIGLLTETLVQKMAANRQEKSFLQKRRLAKLLSKLIKAELTYPEWVIWKELRKLPLETMPVEISRLKNLAEKFYQGAELRDEAMIRNLKKLFQVHRARKAALVIGGFHVERIKKLLAQAGMNYREIRPDRGAQPDGLTRLAGKLNLATYRNAILHTPVPVTQTATMPKPDAAQPAEELLDVDPEGFFAVRRGVRAFLAEAGSLGILGPQKIVPDTEQGLARIPFYALNRKGFQLPQPRTVGDIFKSALTRLQILQALHEFKWIGFYSIEIKGMYSFQGSEVIPPRTALITHGIILRIQVKDDEGKIQSVWQVVPLIERKEPLEQTSSDKPRFSLGEPYQPRDSNLDSIVRWVQNTFGRSLGKTEQGVVKFPEDRKDSPKFLPTSDAPVQDHMETLVRNDAIRKITLFIREKGGVGRKDMLASQLNAVFINLDPERLRDRLTIVYQPPTGTSLTPQEFEPVRRMIQEILEKIFSRPHGHPIPLDPGGIVQSIPIYLNSQLQPAASSLGVLSWQNIIAMIKEEGFQNDLTLGSSEKPGHEITIRLEGDRIVITADTDVTGDSIAYKILENPILRDPKFLHIREAAIRLARKKAPHILLELGEGPSGSSLGTATEDLKVLWQKIISLKPGQPGRWTFTIPTDPRFNTEVSVSLIVNGKSGRNVTVTMTRTVVNRKKGTAILAIAIASDRIDNEYVFIREVIRKLSEALGRFRWEELHSNISHSIMLWADPDATSQSSGNSLGAELAVAKITDGLINFSTAKAFHTRAGKLIGLLEQERATFLNQTQVLRGIRQMAQSA